MKFKTTTCSNCKFPNEHSDKICVCGGHNAHNVKKNKNHNSTKKRLQYRKEKQFINKIKNINENG